MDKCRHKTGSGGTRGIKIPPRFYRIGELVQYTPFSRQTLHNYTTMGLIQECAWTKGGHRLYDETVFERLALIMELRKTKTLAQIKSVLEEKFGSSRNDSSNGTQCKEAG